MEAEVSQRHLSFIESGRAAPSREMVLRLAEHLEIPFRERNAMLLAAGYSPVFRDRPLEDPTLSHAKAALETLLRAHEPYPALIVDRHWNIVSANRALAPLLAGVDSELLKPPANALRISLHPRGLAPKIVNLTEWRQHLLDRLRRQFRISRDPALDTLLKDLSGYPFSSSERLSNFNDTLANEVAILLRLKTPKGVLSFLSTVTVFGTRSYYLRVYRYIRPHEAMVKGWDKKNRQKCKLGKRLYRLLRILFLCPRTGTSSTLKKRPVIPHKVNRYCSHRDGEECQIDPGLPVPKRPGGNE
jgi:transcriptional regulator with XRE-family HTH domain